MFYPLTLGNSECVTDREVNRQGGKQKDRDNVVVIATFQSAGDKKMNWVVPAKLTYCLIFVSDSALVELTSQAYC